ncbi:dihydropyrimidinase [Anabrus simplex]|uniref:dihydropyrimidinase n=1 Tax=Anabrus simplex TaxID=316456 RepID=UPI0035A37FF2
MAAFGRLANYFFRITSKFSSLKNGKCNFTTAGIGCLASGCLVWYAGYQITKSAGIVHATEAYELCPRSVLIKNGVIVNADKIVREDIYLDGGIIKQIGGQIETTLDTKVIDADGSYIIPGGIDPHTHLEQELMSTKTVDDYFTGTKAALRGGTTTIIDFAIPSKGQSLIETYQKRREAAAGKVCCDYGLHVGVTWWSDKVRQEMEELAGKHGVNSFKMFMSKKNNWMMTDAEMIPVFQTCRRVGAVALVHAENGNVIEENQKKLLELGITGPEGHLLSCPEEVEAEAVNRACVLANQCGCPLYVVHVMSKGASSVLQEKRLAGAVVFGETRVAAIGTDGSHYLNTCWRHAAGHVMSPPLRPDPTTPAHLIQLLNNDGLQCTSSDHSVFNATQKFVGREDFTKIPCGANGIEERLAVIWEKTVAQGRMNPMRFVEITSTNAAKIFNLYPKKGCIAEGSDADIVIWNPKKTQTISANKQEIDFNIFEGQEVHGVPEYVFLRGHMVVENGQLRARKGMGLFVEMLNFPTYVYGQVRKKDEGDHLLKVVRHPGCIKERRHSG